MSGGHLKKVQRNKVLQHVEKMRFDPTDFRWDKPSEHRDGIRYMGSGPAQESLHHKPSGSYFRFKFIEDEHPGRIHRRNTKDHHVEYRPSETGNVERQLGPLDWSGALSCLDVWLKVVKQEEEAPNLWAQLRDSGDRIRAWESEQFGSEPFTPEQQSYLKEGLDDFENWVEEKFDLQNDGIATLHREVDDLREQVASLKRRQWASLGLGVILKVGLHVGFSNADFSHVVEFFDELLSGVPKLPSSA